ncbi:yeats-domain-containing protein, partial [Piromyces finnis]
NVTIVKPIIYGSYAVPLQKKLENGHTHRWTVFVRGVNGEDISTYIKKVVFRLHESFENPNRGSWWILFPYEVSETGWGEFEILLNFISRSVFHEPVQSMHKFLTTPSNISDNKPEYLINIILKIEKNGASTNKKYQQKVLQE